MPSRCASASTAGVVSPEIRITRLPCRISAATASSAPGRSASVKVKATGGWSPILRKVAVSGTPCAPVQPARPRRISRTVHGALGAVAGHLGHVADRGGRKPGLGGRLGDRARQRMRRALRQGQRAFHRLGRQGVEIGQARRAGGQRAGLVEDHRVDLRQPLECRFVLDQHAAPKEPPRGRRRHRRHRQPERAGAGDDQHRRGDVERRAHVPRIKIPARKLSPARMCTPGA